MSELNVSLLEDVAGAIVMHPEEFDMGEWCGTTRCVAGWTVLLGEQRGLVKVPQSTKDGVTHTVYPTCDRGPVHIQDSARELLGLTRLEAEELFFMNAADNDEVSLQEALREITPEQAHDYIKKFIEDKQRG